MRTERAPELYRLLAGRKEITLRKVECLRAGNIGIGNMATGCLELDIHGASGDGEVPAHED